MFRLVLIELFMIDKIITSQQCTGCKMCGDLCPNCAISFKYDEYGFWMPVVDITKCTKCKLCVSNCPSLSEDNENSGNSVKCYGLLHKDDDIRWQSTSGGFFTSLALWCVKNGGYCAGAIYDDNMNVKHILTNKIEGINALRQSKYVQSDTSSIYKETKSLLQKGEKVLFCGTPCQVAALKTYLHSSYSDLITMDFICCGISSPFVYDKYKDWLENKYKSRIIRIWFKNKKEGWHRIGTEVEFKNGKKYFRIGSRERYMIAFVVDGLDMRDSCSFCKYRKVPHNSDFTVGDFWGIEKLYPELDDNKGISALIINSQKGQDAFYRIQDDFNTFDTNIEEIAKGNFTIYKSKKPHKNREVFLKAIKTISFEKAMNLYSSYSGLNKIRMDLVYYKGKIKSSLSKSLKMKNGKI